MEKPCFISIWKDCSENAAKSSNLLLVSKSPYLLSNFSVSSNRVTSGRKACLALLAPLAMDYKESK